MSQTAEKFASIDTQLAAAKQAWEKEKQEFLDRIVKLELELHHAKTEGRIAVEGRMAAESNSGALQALFAVVRHVLDEAEAKQKEPKGFDSEVKSAAIKSSLAVADRATAPKAEGGPAVSPPKPGDANSV